MTNGPDCGVCLKGKAEQAARNWSCHVGQSAVFALLGHVGNLCPCRDAAGGEHFQRTCALLRLTERGWLLQAPEEHLLDVENAYLDCKGQFASEVEAMLWVSKSS